MNHPLINTLIEKFPACQHNIKRFVEIATLLCDKIKCLDFLAPLFVRLYLVPIFWMAGTQKFSNFSDTVDWFGDDDWGLGLPFPYLLVFLVAGIELFGAIFLFFGVGVRLISIPLMITMAVAAITVHLQHGWLAISTGSGIFATDRTVAAIERLDKAKDILKQYGNYDWLTENGSVVILNNGIEFSVTYFIMLLVLFFMGAGRYVSVDYWLRRNFLDHK
ncbi:MAG: DoxX family protein [Methylococcales bacterium]|nr:DoxX family protein [Methylococcales bacterium]